VARGVLKVEGRDLTVLSEYASDEEPDEIPEGAVLDPDELREAAETAE
jgi:hypothetical protein